MCGFIAIYAGTATVMDICIHREKPKRVHRKRRHRSK